MKARRVFYLSFLIVAAVSAAYTASFDGAFMLDDYGKILENSAIRDFSRALSSFSVRYLADITLAFDYSLGGLNPFYYHLTNLIIHLSCTVVLFLLVKALAVRAGKTAAQAEWMACISAILWGVHPLATAAVTYICQRYESLMTLFYMFSMLCLVKGADRTGARGGALLMLSVVFYLCGVFTKQVIVTAPLLLFLLDSAFLGGSFRKAWRERTIYYCALLACLALQLALIYARPSEHTDMFNSYSARIGSMMYLMNESAVLLQYLRLACWPFNLTLDYAWLPSISVLQLLPSVAVVGGVFLAIVYGFFRWPRAFFAPLSIFIILAPTSSFIPLPDIAFEHRMYLPLAGLIVAMVFWAGWLVLKNRKFIVPAVVIALIAAVALGVRTHDRNRQYADPEGMWGDIVMRIPHNFRAWSFLVNAKILKRDYAGAEKAARQMLARVAMVSALDPMGYETPSSSPIMYEVFARNLLARALIGQRRWKEALHESSLVLMQYPDDFGAAQMKALALLGLGDEVGAENAIDEALRINPGHVGANMAKYTILVESGRHREAVARLEALLTQDPKLIDARLEMAWILSTSKDDSVRNGKRALELLDRIEAELKYAAPALLEARAAALAELGDFEKAVVIQKAALQSAVQELAPSSEKEEMRERLRMYESKTPCRL